MVDKKRTLSRCTGAMTAALFALAAVTLFTPYSVDAEEKIARVVIGEPTRTPILGGQFCEERAGHCKNDAAVPVDTKRSKASFQERDRVKKTANAPITNPAPIGWVQFCQERPGECNNDATARLEVKHSSTSFQDLDGIKKMAYVATGESTRAPIGWIQFCEEQPGECKNDATAPVDVKYSKISFQQLDRVNRYVNDNIKPMTDLEHYGVIEKWAYPDDGYGDCEDYVLLKRRMLMELGWPRSALLITVVRDKKGEGHAVLTVRTDKGEIILDNQENEILPWAVTGYRYVKRQSQSDPNVWVSLGDTRPTTYVAAPR